MASQEKKALSGDTHFYLSIQEVASSLSISEDIIYEIIEEGIVTIDTVTMQFDTEALRCIRLVTRLQKDLGVNIPGAALALELLKEIERLKRR